MPNKCDHCGIPVDYFVNAYGGEWRDAVNTMDADCPEGGLSGVHDVSDPVRPAGDLVGMMHATAALYVWHGDEDSAPQGGDTSSLGYNGMLSTENDWERREAQYVDVPVTAWGDYMGGAVERSNHRSLLRDFPGVFVEISSGYGGHSLALPLDAEVPVYLVDALVKLADDYPLYDEEDHSNLEIEMTDEDWTSWALSDFRQTVEENLAGNSDAYPVDCEMLPTDEALTEWYFDSIRNDSSEYPYAETAVSIVFPDMDDAAARLADEIIDSYRKAWINPDQLSLAV